MNFNWTLTKKLTVGFFVILAVSVISIFACLFIITRSNKIDQKIANQTLPTVLLYKDLNTFFSEVKRLNNSHIYTPNSTDKAQLKTLLSEDFSKLKLRAKELYDISNDAEFIKKLDAVISSLDDLKGFSSSITSQLTSDEDYANDAKVDAALTIYEKKFLPKCKSTSKLIMDNLTFYTQTLNTIQDKKASGYVTIYIVVISFLIILGISGLIGFRFIRKMILNRLVNFKEIISDLSLGQITELETSTQKDEIGDMQNSIRQLIDGLKGNTDFAVEIGKGNYDVEFSALSEHDHLGNALLEMRQNLKRNVEEEKKRIWASQGIAAFSDMLRQDYSDLEEMSDQLLNYLVSYSQSNYGCIFLVEKSVEGNTVLSMKACYAFEQKKFINKTIEIGEGLVGQCYLEKEHIFMTEIPNNYIKITSGLGKALPNAVIIIPIKFNDQVLGILELASFQVYEQYQINLLLQLSENFASSLSNLTMNIKTRQLLDEVKQQSNVLREQEEEMRQNMEELTATQEEMERKTIELEEIKKEQEQTIASLHAELQLLKG
jgi:HAMP domain-containing protein/putative methionine-R-sulfoxide reductase with GAF domain